MRTCGLFFHGYWEVLVGQVWLAGPCRALEEKDTVTEPFAFGSDKYTQIDRDVV